MIPVTSSPSCSFTRTGVAVSMSFLRYLISSSVCSGARADFPANGGVMILLTLGFSLGGQLDSRARRARIALDLTIIAVARRHLQLRPLHAHLQLVKALLRQRHVLRIEAQHILRSQLADDLVECLVQL